MILWCGGVQAQLQQTTHELAEVREQLRLLQRDKVESEQAAATQLKLAKERENDLVAQLRTVEENYTSQQEFVQSQVRLGIAKVNQKAPGGDAICWVQRRCVTHMMYLQFATRSTGPLSLWGELGARTEDIPCETTKISDG